MRRTVPSPRNACLPIFLLIAGCVEPEISPRAPSPDPASPLYGEHLADEDLGEDPLMLALARQHPSFAGVFFEPGTSRLIVASTDAKGTASIRQSVVAMVGTELGHSPTADGAFPLDAVHHIFEYSFLELAQHRARIRPHVFGVPEVQSLSVDEQHNRIKIGLSDLSAKVKIEQIATDLAIPIQMLSFAHELPAQPLYGTSRPSLPRLHSSGPTLQDSITVLSGPTLRDSITVPDNKLRGGYKIKIAGRSGGICTLGFTALQDHNVNFNRFVTNSHCSLRKHQLDAGIWHQPEVRSEFSQIAYEINDKEPHLCRIRGAWEACRHADAALAFPTLGPTDWPLGRDFARGEIGRTTERSDCVACEAAITIDTVNPVILIKGTRRSIIDEETLDKVGQRTGWTYGDVLDTCVDQPDSNHPTERVIILCTGVIEFAVGRGDSGSPVFQYDSTSGSANLVGILWGGIDLRRPGSELKPIGFVSPFEKIEDDFGWLFGVCHGLELFEQCYVQD